MLNSFGARLRQRREEQGIALSTIAEQTKIKQSLLDALERDDVSHWPSGIFRRAFIRAYAHAIGLNPDVVVREFLEIHPEPLDVVAENSVTALGADPMRLDGGPPTRLRNIVGSALDSLSRLRRGVAAEETPASPPIHGLGLSSVEVVAAPIITPEVTVLEPPTVEAGSPTPVVAGITAPAVAIEALPEPSPAPAVVTVPVEPDLMPLAHLCTRLSRVDSTRELQPLLHQAAALLDASGLIIWIWDENAAGLRAALAHGYSDRVLAQLPTVARDDDNATANAFRTSETCTINGSEQSSGALVVPLLTSGGCAGVLAAEMAPGKERASAARAIATIVAAQLAQLVSPPRAAEAPRPEAATPPAVENVMNYRSITPPVPADRYRTVARHRPARRPRPS